MFGGLIMKKYSDEFRVLAVNKVLEIGNIKRAAQELGTNKAILRTWLAHYNAGGIEQLLHKNNTYTSEFKQTVIEYRRRYRLSLVQTIAHFKIPSFSLVLSWEKKYAEEGLIGLLPKAKGRTAKMQKGTKSEINKENKAKEVTREQELEAENEQLRMENAYLKKLNALVQAREEQQSKIK